METSDLCSEQDVTDLVHRFYSKVRDDTLLGPFFGAHVSDWDYHLAKMVDFWSSTLRGTGRYRGAPMPKHVALPDLNGEKFNRWLKLFRETTQTFDNPAFQERANDLALRIAQSLWYGYQIYRTPENLPAELPLG